MFLYLVLDFNNFFLIKLNNLCEFLKGIKRKEKNKIDMVNERL